MLLFEPIEHVTIAQSERFGTERSGGKVCRQQGLGLDDGGGARDDDVARSVRLDATKERIVIGDDEKERLGARKRVRLGLKDDDLLASYRPDGIGLEGPANWNRDWRWVDCHPNPQSGLVTLA